MGLDYALVYTIPPCAVLSALYWPLWTRFDAYKIAFLIVVAVVSTIPWDSYLIRSGVWTYPPHAVLGWTCFDIPAEELFFFVIQTYGTSLLYCLATKPLLFASFLPRRDPPPRAPPAWLERNDRLVGLLGQALLAYAAVAGLRMVWDAGPGTYLGLILAWACPFCLLLWTLQHRMLLRLPWTATLLPIALPTLYLWVVDTFALRRGTWVIVPGTKLDVFLWAGLEVEEAFFFLVTNTMVVFGLIAFDNAMALVDAFPHLMPAGSVFPGPATAIKVLLTPHQTYGDDRLVGIAQALARLRQKSRSFYLASSTFEGRPRIDLVLLYSFCRVADDLIDGSTSAEEAVMWIKRLRAFLDLAYQRDEKRALHDFVAESFPDDTRLSLLLLPVACLSKEPLYGLLDGFEMDLGFSRDFRATAAADAPSTAKRKWPIATQADLEQYGLYVAGTVAELCIDVLLHHYPGSPAAGQRAQFKRAGQRMGIALQLVNIARDVAVDAALDRVYIPTEWLAAADLIPEDVVSNRAPERMPALRTQLLDLAFALYDEARPAIEQLPRQARGPMRVAIESYMEIGRVLRHESRGVVPGRATVPKWRRLLVAWRALCL